MAQGLRLLVAFVVAATRLSVATETVGCFLYGFRLQTVALGNVSTPLSNVGSRVDCQNLCVQAAGCLQFTHYTSSNTCYLGGLATNLVKDAKAVSGPANCPPVPGVCTDVPNASFPASTVPETFNAFASGMQPPALQCWPRTPSGDLQGCSSQILDDFKNGWVGNCWGLHAVPEPNNGTCGDGCRADVKCAMYQTVMWQSGLKCWHGSGYNCLDANRSINILSAQRLLRGSYRVLKPLFGNGLTINGMRKMFTVTEVSDAQQGIKACNHTCLGVISCQYWQYSSVHGCFADVPTAKEHMNVGYPGVTPTIWKRGGTFATTVIAGEYIQRFCGAKPVATVGSASASRIISWGTTTTTLPYISSDQAAYGLPHPWTATVAADTTPIPVIAYIPPAVSAMGVATRPQDVQQPQDESGVPASWHSTTLWVILGLFLMLACVVLGTFGVLWMHKRTSTQFAKRGVKQKARSESSDEEEGDSDKLLHSGVSSQRSGVSSQSSPSQATRPAVSTGRQPLIASTATQPAMELFNMLDRNHDGRISREEFQQLVNAGKATQLQADRCACGKVYTKTDARFCSMCGRPRG